MDRERYARMIGTPKHEHSKQNKNRRMKRKNLKK